MRPRYKPEHRVTLNVPGPRRLCQLTLCHFLVALGPPPIQPLGQRLLPQYHTRLTNLHIPMSYTPVMLCPLRTSAMLIVTTDMRLAPYRRFKRRILFPRNLMFLNRGRQYQRLTPMNSPMVLKQQPGRYTESMGQPLSQNHPPLLLRYSLQLPLSSPIRGLGSKSPSQPSPPNNPRRQHPQSVRLPSTVIQVTTTYLPERTPTQ